MKDILSYILDNILDKGVATVEEENVDGSILLKISAPQEEMGKIIGKSGRTINSIKNILKIKAIKDGVRVDVQVTEKE